MAVENTTTKMITDAEATSSWIEHLTSGYKKFIALRSVDDCNDNNDPSGSGSSPKCIFRFPQHLVELVGENCHLREPQMVALGPYHHGEEQLKFMEDQKEEALFRVLHLSDLKEDVSKLVKRLSDVEQQLRDCYDGDLESWSSEDFIKMMLLDGCFLLDFGYRLDEDAEGTPAESKPTQLLYDSNFDALVGDISLLENQIPLLVLDVLCQETGHVLGLSQQEQWPQALHMLHSFRTSLLGEKPPTRSPPSTLPGMEYFLSRYENGKELLHRYLPCLEDRQNQAAERLPVFATDKYLRSAKKLRDAGVTFKRVPPFLYGVRFHKGVLYLPELELDETQLKAFVNLVALERMRPQLGTDITSFMCFMDFLIDTAEDVSFLGEEGIVKNNLESDEAAAKFFNFKLGVVTMCSPFREVQEEVRKYASAGHHGWWVHLKDNHLANPWTILALIGSLFLLCLTAVQTVYTTLTFYRSN